MDIAKSMRRVAVEIGKADGTMVAFTAAMQQPASALRLPRRFAGIYTQGQYEAECLALTAEVAALAQMPVGEFEVAFLAWLGTTAADYLHGLDYCRGRLQRGQLLPWLAD